MAKMYMVFYKSGPSACPAVFVSNYIIHVTKCNTQYIVVHYAIHALKLPCHAIYLEELVVM